MTKPIIPTTFAIANNQASLGGNNHEVMNEPIVISS
jgi:hypothetical protein